MDDLPATTLEFPERSLDTGVRVTTIDVSTLNNVQLLELVRQWDLKPARRNRASYVQVLKDFSADRNAWTKKHMPRKHKGPRTISYGKHTKISTLRRIELMGPMAERILTVSAQTKDSRTQAEVDGLLEWARGIADISNRGTPTPHRGSGSETDSTLAPPSSRLSQCMQKLDELVSLLRDQEHLIPAVDNMNPQNSLASIANEAVDSYSLATRLNPSLVGVDSTSSLPLDGANPNLASTPPRSCTLRLANSTIRYCPSDIPDPPAISFVRCLSRLDEMWDDRSPQWNDSSPLYICGRSIPLVYWPSVYRYQGNTQWKGIKQRWFEWKSLVTEYRALGPASFWNKYSENNKNLPITSILQQIKKARLEENFRAVELAKSLYGDKFCEAFSYRSPRESKPQVLTRPSAIAKRFRCMSASLTIQPTG